MGKRPRDWKPTADDSRAMVIYRIVMDGDSSHRDRHRPGGARRLYLLAIVRKRPFFHNEGIAMNAIQRRRRTFRPAMECCEDRFLMASFAWNPVTTAVAPAVWKPVSAPGFPGNVLTTPTGVPDVGIQLNGAKTAQGTATYMFPGLTQGYYQITVYYYASAGDATKLGVAYKTASTQVP